MIKNLFDNYQKILEKFFNTIDIKSAEKIFQYFYQCQGTVIFTGVGKSGIIAEKLATTMTSTGTKSLFISPINALHGDIGILNNQDIVVFISKSGKTDELLQLLSFVKNRGIKTVAWVSRADSKIGALCNEKIILPVEKELCPYNLAPTTSAAIQMIFGDVLSIALMHKKKFGLASYALNHPAGSIGMKIHLKVEDIMLKDDKLPLCFAVDKLKDVLVKLTSMQCGCLLIVNKERKMEGIFTDGDLRRALEKNRETVLDKPMHELMTTKFISSQQGALVSEATKKMQEDPKRHVMVLPIVDKECIVGLIRMHDIVQLG